MMIIKEIFVAVLFLALTFPALAAEPSPPNSPAARVVKEFYQYHFHHDMSFNKTSLKARQKWLDVSLYDLLLKELQKPQSPDEVPDIDGDPFTCSQEYPNAIRVTQATESVDTANVVVVFLWPKGGNPPRAATIQLRKEAKSGPWKIVNIVLADGYDLVGDLLKK